MATTVAPPTTTYGWMRNARFDLFFILGVAAVAIFSGVLVVMKPGLFHLVLFLDLMLLGYPHVIATFTRLTFDTESFRETRFLTLGLPWLVLAGTLAIGKFAGLWALATIYLYWQWFHYTRQSYGILRIFSRKAGGEIPGGELLSKAALYTIPLWGILFRSFEKQPLFLGFEVRYVPAPQILVMAVGIVALGASAVWAFCQFRAYQEGRGSLALSLYMLSHAAVFFVGYIAIRDITHGWLVINIWHNAQYLLIVWMYNNMRFKNGVDKKHRFLSTISQGSAKHVAAFFAVILGISTVVYGLLAVMLKQPALAAIPLASLVTYQTINFHHYVVDSRIWKVRKKKMQQRLGINA